jgi:Holliday junction resolvase-like predicted endonuclease
MERSDWTEFEDLVGKVVESLGFQVELRFRRPYGPRGGAREIDILARRGEGIVLPIEVKLSRRERVTLSRLRDASSQTSRLRDMASNARPLLVYGGYIDAARQAWAEDEFGIEIWDRDLLLQRAGPTTEPLLGFFKRLDEQRSHERASSPTAPPDVGEAADDGDQSDPQLEPLGEALIANLTALPPGKKNAKAYEAICRDIIEYLFGDDLRDVRSQKRTADGLNVYDLVYRVSPKHPFWVTLTRDFRARVVLFECKNYGKSIGAMQVFTTERYLSASAFRPVCFVLSRKAAHPHAVQAAAGAMRESGKLLVFLSDDDLIKMLKTKDAQLREGGSTADMQANDPTEILDQTIYDFVVGLAR